METIPSYESQPGLRSLQTRVVESGSEEDRPWVVLDDTILYPQGGGQPCDRGWLDDVEVVDVQRREGRILHYLSAPAAEGAACLRLDWARRFDHMQQHTAQHLISAIAQDEFGWATTSFHLGQESCDVELDAHSLEEDAIARLEERVAAEVRAARKVTARRVTGEEFRRLPVRSRGLPKGFEGRSVRLVEIEGIDLASCGGTHLASTSEIESVALLEAASMRGGTRLFFLAGGRLRRRLRRRERDAYQLRRMLGVGDEQLLPTIEAKGRQLTQSQRARKRILAQLAQAEALLMAGRDESAIEAHFVDRDLGFLQNVARQLIEHAPEKAVFLTSAIDSESFFALAAGERSGLDAGAVGRELCRPLKGKGGGSGRLFQGRVGDLGGRADALEILRRKAAEASSRT